MRFNCHSKQSKQPDSGQLIIDADKIPLDLSIEHVKTTNSLIQISWNLESNQADTIIPLKFLLSNWPGESSQKTRNYKCLKVDNLYYFFNFLYKYVLFMLSNILGS